MVQINNKEWDKNSAGPKLNFFRMRHTNKFESETSNSTMVKIPYSSYCRIYIAQKIPGCVNGMTGGIQDWPANLFLSSNFNCLVVNSKTA